MSETRVDVVRQAFYTLDKEGKGYVPVSELLSKYNPAGHPRVKAMEKTPQEIFDDFQFAIKRIAYNVYLFL